MFAFALSLLADSFITNEEYSKMLYQNPRGIGCHKCHGLRGEGLELGRYKEGNETVIVRAPDIRHLSFERFSKALKKQKHKLMPFYFLTDKEIETLYNYIRKKR